MVEFGRSGFVAGALTGAGLMYWMDPRGGRRRRAVLADRVRHVKEEARGAIGLTARDLAQRSCGMFSDLRSRFGRAPTGDEVLVERVRSQLGRVCSHPGALAVSASAGRVELRGRVLRPELKAILAATFHVRGVRDVINHLEVHEKPGHVPELQGVGKLPRRFPLLRQNWTPTSRLIAGGLGLGLFAKGPMGGLGRIVGAGLFLRAATNSELRRLFGIRGAGRGIELEKAIHIAAPVPEVFAFWRRLENFPRFMSHVREVRRLDDRRFHWEVVGPAGIPFSWEAKIDRWVDDRMVSWSSLPGSIVGQCGVVRFDPEGEGTRLQVRLSYTPPGGAIGHAFARVLGADPKRQMDDDLMRLKSLLEQGKATGAAETVTREEVEAWPAEPRPRREGPPASQPEPH